MYKRLCNPLKSHSFFLFGARGTGKTTLMRSLLEKENVFWIDLLDKNEEDRYARNPSLLYREVQAKSGTINWVVIDEVQKVPPLLDTVHRIIETHEFKAPQFALTGSSARKLKHGGANLLAGRAFVNSLHPLTLLEYGNDVDLDFVLNWGSLPKIFSFTNDNERQEFLRAYGLTYLKEEVWAEHLVQELEPFRKFLEVSAQTNSEIINYSKIARDVNVHENTVKKYFQILEDTWLGFLLEPYSKSVRKRLRKNSKFYFFDLGVKRALERTLGQSIIENTYAYGKAFEHFIILECFRLNEYFKKDFSFSYLRTKDDAEIDLIVDRPGQLTIIAEIKSSAIAQESDIRTLKAFNTDIPNSKAILISRDPHEQIIDGIHFLHWKKAINEIMLI